MEITTTAKELQDLIPDVLKANLTPMIHGSPGIGKSDIIRKIADTYNLEVITYILSNRDPVDIIGFPTLVLDKTRSDTAPPLIFPIEGDELPEGKEGWLLFFDEINSAPAMMQAASYHVILDKMVGNKKLHSKVFTIAAGNLETDNAIVNRLSTAMQSRLIHFTLEVNLNAWLDWAPRADIDYRIISLIKFKPELLHNFNPDHSDNTFACPRTWFFLSEIVKNWENIPNTKLAIIAGTVGTGAAHEFKGFVDIMESLPSIEAILNDPEGIPIPNEPSTKYAISGSIAHHASNENLDKLMLLITRLPKEFQLICMTDLIKKKDHLMNHGSVREWIKMNAEFLIS